MRPQLDHPPGGGPRNPLREEHQYAATWCSWVVKVNLLAARVNLSKARPDHRKSVDFQIGAHEFVAVSVL